MAPGPMQKAAEAALCVRASYAAEKDFEAVEAIEIDCVEAVKCLMREGSPMLANAIVSVIRRLASVAA